MKFNLLFKSASIYILAGVANSSIPFLLLPILTRVLPPSEYGKVVMYSSLLTVFSAFIGLNVHGSVSVRYFDKKINHSEYLGTSVFLLVASLAIAIFFIVLFGDNISSYTGISICWIIVAIFASSAQFVVQLRLLMWQVSQNAIKYGIFLISHTTSNLLISLFLIVCLGYDWSGRGVGISVSVIIFCLIAIFSMVVDNIIRFNFNLSYAKSMIKFGVPLIPHSIGGILLSMSDRFVVSGMLGIEEAGLYAAAMQVGMVVLVISDACNKAFAPWLFKVLSGNNIKEKIVIIKFTYLLFIIIPVLAVIFGWVAPWVLRIMVGSQYQNSADVVLYIALGGGFGAMYFLVANYIFYAEKTIMLSCVTVVSGLINVCLSVILVKSSGSVGAAQAYMISQAVCFFLTWIVAIFVYPMPWNVRIRQYE